MASFQSPRAPFGSLVLVRLECVHLGGDTNTNLALACKSTVVKYLVRAGDDDLLCQRNTQPSTSTTLRTLKTITLVSHKPRRYATVWLTFIQLAVDVALQPYYQPDPAAPTPYSSNNAYYDPSFPSSFDMAWAMYIQTSSNIILFGASRGHARSPSTHHRLSSRCRLL